MPYEYEDTSEEGVLDELTTDYTRLQNQKAKKTGLSVELRVLRALAFYFSEHHLTESSRSLTVPANEDNKLYLVFNLLAQRAKKFMGRVSTAAINGRFKTVPDKQDVKAWSDAEVIDKLIIALDDKVKQPSRTWEILFWLIYGGVAFEAITWQPSSVVESLPKFNDAGEVLFRYTADPSDENEYSAAEVEQIVEQGLAPKEYFEVIQVEEQTGDVQSTVYGPLNVFLDASVRSIADLAPDQGVYIAEVKTKGWVLENFGYDAEGMPNQEVIAKINEVGGDKHIKIVQTEFNQLGPSHGMLDLQDMIPAVQGTVGEDDPEMFQIVHRYQPAGKKYPKGRYTIFIPGKLILRDAENPYGEIPVIDYHLEPVTTTFWTKDYVSDLIAPQKFLNKRLSQMGEEANANIHGKVLLGPGLSRTSLSPDEPEAIENAITEQGIPLVHRLEGPQLPGWFLKSIELSIQLINDLAGGADLFQQSKFPGQLRGPMAIPMLQEIMDSEWTNLYEHLGEQFARAKQMRLNRVRDFYPPIRTMHYTDENQRDEVFEFHSRKIWASGTTYSVRIERGTFIPELRAIREAAVIERLNSPVGILYMDERTGQLDKSKLASDLKFGDSGRVSRASQYRKLQIEINERIYKGMPLPPVLPFWDHPAMMDELEACMATMEWLNASQEIQKVFMERHAQHGAFMQQAAQRQQQFMQNQMVQGAVAQAVQQSAAQTASATVDAVMSQMLVQAQNAPNVEQDITRGVQANQQAGMIQ
jgi:hypothetical protein